MNVGARRHMHALEPGGVAVAAAAVAAAAAGAPTKYVMAGAPANNTQTATRWGARSLVRWGVGGSPRRRAAMRPAAWADG